MIYSSTDGHTKTICERIANLSSDKNLVKILSLKEAEEIDLNQFNKIIVGASIRYGKHSKDLYKFIRLNKNLLEKIDKNDFIYIGCQILNKDLFKNYKLNNFPISVIWNELLKKNELNGFQSFNKFYHLTNLETFRKLQDL